MRQFLHLIAVITILLSSCGQSQNEAVNKIRRDLEIANKQFPLEVSCITLQKMAIEGNDYTVYVSLDETQMSLDDYMADINDREAFSFKFLSGFHKDFAETFIKSGLNMKFIITGKQSKRQEQFFMAAEDIANINNSEDLDYTARTYLEEGINAVQADIPEDWGDGLTLIGNYIEGDYIYYVIHTDETVLTMPLLKMSMEDDELVESILEELNSTGETLEGKLFIKYIKESGLGIVYSYVGDSSKDPVNITITPKMIRERL